MIYLDPILKQIDSGRFACPLVKASLKRDGKIEPTAGISFEAVECHGNGFLRWSMESGVEVDLLTNNARQISALPVYDKSPVGEIVPDDCYLLLNSTSQTGEAVTCNRVEPYCASAHSESEFASWTIRGTELLAPIEVSEDKDKHTDIGGEAVTVLLQTEFDEWTHSVDVKTSSILGQSRRSSRNGIEFTPSFGKVTMLKLPSGNCIARIESDDAPNGVVEAVRMACSFVAGRIARLIAMQFINGKRRVTRLGYKNTRQELNKLFAPCQQLDEASRIKLIESASNCFSTSEGEVVADHLHACLEANGRNINEFGRTITSSIEGLMKHLLDKERVEVSNEMKRWENVGLLVEDGERKSWETLRHKLAHGGLVGRSGRGMSLGEAVRFSNPVKHLLLKLILCCIGYNGAYRNPLGEAANFPAITPGDLRAR